MDFLVISKIVHMIKSQRCRKGKNMYLKACSSPCSTSQSMAPEILSLFPSVDPGEVCTLLNEN